MEKLELMWARFKAQMEAMQRGEVLPWEPECPTIAALLRQMLAA